MAGNQDSWWRRRTSLLLTNQNWQGWKAIPAALELADKYDVEMPIVFAVDAVVNRGADARETVDALMLREKKSEMTK